MDDVLCDILKQLEYIKTSIVKLGPTRRVGENFCRKVSEAKLIYGKFKEILSSSTNVTSNETVLLCTTINECYSKILSFDQDDSLIDITTLETKSDEMSEKFCLKTATSLLPKMSDSETVTQELIDAIEFYNSMLGDDGKQFLINFILKCRISSGAKLRLSATYTSIESLIRDMRMHLLTKKSDTSLQQQMLNERQGDRSIREYGSEIERLLIDLTISQADGDQSAYKTLQPINERNAIRCFANGLTSQRIGTIISARNVTQLKDAIRIAEDETNALPKPQVCSYNRGRTNSRRFPNSRNYSGYARPPTQQGQYSGYQHTRGNWRGVGTQGASGYRARGSGHRARAADAAFRGRYVRDYRPTCSHLNLNHFNANDDINQNADANDNEVENKEENSGNEEVEFFRR